MGEPSSYAVIGEWLVQEADGCTCYGGGPYGHEPGCGYEPVAKISEIEATLSAVNRLRKLHYGIDTSDRYTSGGLICQECGKASPCPTQQALTNPS